jgi:hypothetical protein
LAKKTTADASAGAANDEPSSDEATKQTRKGTPTPTRKEREAANKRPLVPSDRKEAARQSRAKSTELRERARIGMAAGDDRYLTARDRGPQRRYVRDYVDARYGIGEFMIPIILFVLILSFVQSLQAYSILVLWFFVLVTIVDSIFLGFRLNKLIAEKFGAGKVERGLRWYATMRSIQLRIMRLPKPQVKRREFPS